MDTSIHHARAMQFLDPHLGLSDIEGLVAFRITEHHSVQQLFCFLLTSGAQARPGCLQCARGGQCFGINGRTNRLSRDKSVQTLGNIWGWNHMRICRLLQLFCCR